MVKGIMPVDRAAVAAAVVAVVTKVAPPVVARLVVVNNTVAMPRGINKGGLRAASNKAGSDKVDRLSTVNGGMVPRSVPMAISKATRTNRANPVVRKVPRLRCREFWNCIRRGMASCVIRRPVIFHKRLIRLFPAR